MRWEIATTTDHALQSLAIRLVALAAGAAYVVLHVDLASALAGGVAYAGAIIPVALLARRRRSWLVSASGPIVDAVALGTLVFAVGGVSPPPWTLGGLALVAAASGGFRPLAVAAGTIPVAVVTGGLATPAGAAASTLLAAAILMLLGGGLLLISRRWEGAGGATWRSHARALTRLNRPTSAGGLTAAMVDVARELLRADAARLWRWSPRGGGESVAVSGDPALLPAAALPVGALEQFARGHDDLVHRLLQELPGHFLLLPLAQDDQAPALMAICWRDRPPSRHLRRRGRLLTAWLLDALVRLRAYEAGAAEQRRAQALAEASERFAAAGAAAEVLRDAVQVLRGTLGVPAAATDAKHAVICGDAGLAASREGVTLLDVGNGVRLAVDAAGLREGELRWLETLAATTRRALRRTEARVRLEAEHALFRASIERLPAPVVVRERSGSVVATSEAFRRLALPLPEAEDEEPFEVSSGTPPGYFVAASARLPEGRRLTYYREVTKEREALRAKDELIATMGHELRTPLTSVRGYSQMMSRHLDVVREQVGRLDAMIQDFIETAQLPGAALPIHREALDPADLVHDAAARFYGSWEGRELRLSVGPALPVSGDPERLHQVLDNLLGNAAKYSPDDSPIDLAVRGEGGRVLVSVRDYGEGIEAEHLAHLFERSYRVPGGHAPGQGLGLAIVRDLVAAHGGEVWAESAGRGAGSRLIVSLPSIEVAPPASGGASAGPPGASEADGPE